MDEETCIELSLPHQPHELLLTYCVYADDELQEGFVVMEKDAWADLKQQALSLGERVWKLDLSLEVRREYVQLKTHNLYGGAKSATYFRPHTFFADIDEKLITADQASTFRALFANGMLGPLNLGLTMNVYIQKLNKILASEEKNVHKT